MMTIRTLDDLLVFVADDTTGIIAEQRIEHLRLSGSHCWSRKLVVALRFNL